MSGALDLMDSIRACRLCGDLPLGPRPILQLSPFARILVASQAPGRRAHGSGIPFDDASGDRLRGWLGVTREEFYDPALFAILPMGFCYPGTGPQGDFAPRPQCAATWRSRALAQLPALELTLAIGQHAIGWHRSGARQTVTQAVRSGTQDVIALPHPSPRNNRWLAANRWFEQEVLPPLRQRVRAIIGRAVSTS